MVAELGPAQPQLVKCIFFVQVCKVILSVRTVQVYSTVKCHNSTGIQYSAVLEHYRCEILECVRTVQLYSVRTVQLYSVRTVQVYSMGTVQVYSSIQWWWWPAGQTTTEKQQVVSDSLNYFKVKS